MARFKPIHQGLKLLPVDFDRQVIPGSFDYALGHLVDRELDLSAFHARYRNGLESESGSRAASTLKPVFGNLRGNKRLLSPEKQEAKKKTKVWFEKDPPNAETGVHNGVFLQRS